VETGDSFLTLEHAKDLREPIFIFTDSANHLSEIDDWIGSGRYRSTVHFSKDGDILRLHGDARRGCPPSVECPKFSIYQFTLDPSDSEDTLYMASMNDTVKKFIKNQAAMSNLYSSHSPGVTESFLRRPYSSRDLLGACLSRSSFPEKAKKRLIQSVGFQFPSRALL